MTELRQPEPLDPEVHERSAFDSGEPELDEWLRRYSTPEPPAEHRGDLGDRRCGRRGGCLRERADDQHRPQRRAVIAKHAPDPTPALLIGRLPVDRSLAGRSVGTALVAHVLATAVEVNEPLGFHPFDPADLDNFDLYLLSTEIDSTLRSLG